MNNVQLLLNGVEANIISYSFRKNIFHGAATLEVSVSPLDTYTLFDKPVIADLYISPSNTASNGAHVFHGYVDTIKKSYDKHEKKQTITARDVCAIYIDNKIPIIENFQGIDFTEIVDTITNYFPISTLNDEPVVPPFDLPFPSILFSTEGLATINTKFLKTKYISGHPGESYYDFLMRILNPYDLIMYVPRDAWYIESYADTLQVEVLGGTAERSYNNNVYVGPQRFTFSTDYISSVNAVISCKYTEDITKYYPYVKAVGQTDGPQIDYTVGGVSNKKNYNELKAERLDKYWRSLNKCRVENLKEIDQAAWQGDQVENMLDTIFKEMTRNTQTTQYTLAGHMFTPNVTAGTAQIPFNINDEVFVKDSFLGIEGSYLIVELEMKGDKQSGQTTTVDLALLGTSVNGILGNSQQLVQLARTNELQPATQKAL